MYKRQVDCNNTQALRYLKELNQETDKDQPKEEEKNKDYIAYTRDNETIIQPVGVKDNSGFHAILNVVIGLVIGVAVMLSLIHISMTAPGRMWKQPFLKRLPRCMRRLMPSVRTCIKF